MLIGAEVGVLVEAVVPAEVAAVVQPGAGVVLDVSGISQPSSVPPVWFERTAEPPSDLNLPLAFKPESQPVLSITRAAYRARPSSP